MAGKIGTPILVLVFLCLSSIFQANAQFVNTGEIYIEEGTIVWTQYPFRNTETAKFINNGTLVFISDVANDGEFSHTPTQNSGLVRLEGNLPQRISGASAINFWDLRLLNSQDFNLSNSFSIGGEADFSDGILRAGSLENVVNFSRSAVSINSSDDSFVDGKVGADIDRELLFPLGDELYRRILLVSPLPGTNNLDLRARYFLEDPGQLFPRDQKARNVILVDDAEYWELENLKAETSEMILTLSWRDVTTPPFILGELNKLGIVRWDQDQGLWISEGGNLDLENQLVSTETLLSGTQIYTLGILTGFTNLGVTKTSFGKSIWEGDQFDYEIKLQNNSQVTATDVVLVDNLPDRLEFVSVVGKSIFGLLEFEVETLGQSVLIRIPEFIGGDEATFTLKVRATDPGRITNIAEVSSFEPDENQADNLDMDENEVKEFFIPNVITPNSDGSNDQFEIKGLNKFVSNKLTIFTRWGDSIFEKENYQNNWKAEGLVAGTYFYVIEVVEENGESQSFKGWIQVIKQ